MHGDDDPLEKFKRQTFEAFRALLPYLDSIQEELAKTTTSNEKIWREFHGMRSTLERITTPDFKDHHR